MDGPKIVGTRVLVFLGAGASKPLGKMLMGEFVESLANSNPPDEYLFNAIVSEQKDLEFLLQQLDDLAAKDYLAGATSRPRMLREPGPTWAQTANMWSRAKETSEWVKQGVFRHYRELILNTISEQSYERLFAAASPALNPSVVFTTNYDAAVEEFCRLKKLKLVDGFVNDQYGAEYSWDRAAFDDFSANTSIDDAAVVLFKLHGSTTWVRQGSRIIKNRPVFAQNDPAIENVLIYPATRKIAVDNPYFTAYDYLERCLLCAESCVFVGYSFRDYDVLTRLKASQLWNHRLRIIVLDPRAQQLVKTMLEPNGIRAVPIPFPFGQQEDLYFSRLQKALQQ